MNLINVYWEEVLGDSPISKQMQNSLVHKYSDPNRKYHDIYHIDECLECISLYVSHSSIKDYYKHLVVAIMYHDVEYFKTGSDGVTPERSSANTAITDLTRLGWDKSDIDIVEALIMATEYSKTMFDPYANVPEHMMDGNFESVVLTMRDVDFHGIGNSSTFGMLNNGSGVVNEFRTFGSSDQEILTGRIAFLGKLLTAENIFYSAKFINLFDKNARINIKIEIAMLTTFGLEFYNEL
jgi:predicted metal-dependent HD superfamily phosphohydrolase